jgi:hypothetical protein
MEPNKPELHPYILIRQVTKDECRWLDRTFDEGEIVYWFLSSTYKCISETGLAFTIIPNKRPFFQLPKNAVTPAYELLQFNK